MHHCGHSGATVPCVEFLDHDHVTCEITGCWIRNRNFQQSYTDTAVAHHRGAPPEIATRPWVEEEAVVRWLRVLLASDAARKCLAREVRRVADKATCAFARVAKAYKLAGRPPDVLAMFTETAFVLGTLRVPAAGAGDHRALIDACASAVMRFATAFRWVLAPAVPPVKLDAFIIGLVYMLRHGLVLCDTIHVIPRVPALKRLLPMETSLKAHFKVQCKIITETENIVKNVLKRMDRRAVKALLARRVFG